MENFLIPPEYCLILSAFRQKGTLRGTASLLGTDPATMVRKFQKISSEYGLLIKTNKKWLISEKGQRVALWLDECIASQKIVLDEKPKIRIATFSWLAEQKLIPHFTKLSSETQHKYNWVFKTLSSNLEQELISGMSDFVITGYAPNDPLVAFKKITSRSWKVIAPYEWKKELSHLKEDQLIPYLKTKPFIRLTAMPPVNLLHFELTKFSDLQIDGVIGIRSAVTAGVGWSCVPAMSIDELIKEQKLLVLDLPTLITDQVSLWWLRSRKDTTTYSKILIKWIAEF